MRNTPTLRPPAATTPRRRHRTGVYRAALIVAATTALTTATLGLASPAGAAAAPGAFPAYTTNNIPVADLPGRVAVDQSTHTAYVTQVRFAPQGSIAPNGRVSVIDLTTNQVIHTIEVGPNPSGVAVDEGNHRVYVANSGTQDIVGPPIGNTVSVIDTTTSTLVGAVAIAGYPEAVAVDHRTHRVYVSNRGVGYITFNAVSVIDPATLQVSDTVPVSQPGAIALDEGTNTAYVSVTGIGTCGCEGAVSAINLTSKQVTNISVGPGPFGVDVDVDQGTHRAYVANTGYTRGDGVHFGSTLSVIDTTTNKLTDTVFVGDSPIIVALDPAAHTAYVTKSDGAVAVVDTTTNRLVGTVIVGGNPAGVAVYEGTHSAYVANGLDKGHGAVVTRQRDGNTEPTTTSVGAINAVAGTSSVLFTTVAPGMAGRECGLQRWAVHHRWV